MSPTPNVPDNGNSDEVTLLNVTRSEKPKKISLLIISEDKNIPKIQQEHIESIAHEIRLENAPSTSCNIKDLKSNYKLKTTTPCSSEPVDIDFKSKKSITHDPTNLSNAKQPEKSTNELVSDLMKNFNTGVIEKPIHNKEVSARNQENTPGMFYGSSVNSKVMSENEDDEVEILDIVESGSKKSSLATAKVKRKNIISLTSDPDYTKKLNDQDYIKSVILNHERTKTCRHKLKTATPQDVQLLADYWNKNSNSKQKPIFSFPAIAFLATRWASQTFLKQQDIHNFMTGLFLYYQRKDPRCYEKDIYESLNQSPYFQKMSHHQSYHDYWMIKMPVNWICGISGNLNSCS